MCQLTAIACKSNTIKLTSFNEGVGDFVVNVIHISGVVEIFQHTFVQKIIAEQEGQLCVLLRYASLCLLKARFRGRRMLRNVANVNQHLARRLVVHGVNRLGVRVELVHVTVGVDQRLQDSR